MNRLPGPIPRAVVMIDSSTASADAALHLLSIGNRAVIQRVLDSFADAGIREVTVALEPGIAGQIQDLLQSNGAWRFALRYVTRPVGEGLLDALSRAGEPSLDSPLLVHWACGLFKASLGSLLHDATVGALDAVLLIPRPQTGGRVVELVSERLAALLAQPREQSSGGLAGLALLGASAPEVARQLRPGPSTDLDILALIGRMAELGGRVRVLPAGVCWRYTGAVGSELEVNRYLLSDLAGERPELELPGTTVEGPVQIDSSATIERSTVRGPVVLGARTCLLDAWIGPYTSIGADVYIEGAEIENSIVLDETRITHLDRRLEASVVGPRATVCRDFRLPRAIRLQVGEGARVSFT